MDNFLNMYSHFQDRQNHPSAPPGISSSNHSPGGAGNRQEDNDNPTNLVHHQRAQKGGEEPNRVHRYYGGGAAMMGEEEREGGFHPGGGQTNKMMGGGGGMQERWGPPGGMFGEGGGGGGYGGGGGPSNDFIPPREWRRGEQGQARSPKGKHHHHDKDKNGLKKKAALTSKCCVCGAAAAEHVHYGAICCYSCRAFFRRSGARNYQCIRGDNLCEVNTKFRKYCKKCRYKKCIDSGMKPELVDASRRNKEADIKALQTDTVQINPIKEEQILTEEDITAPVSPDRAVSSSIKTETPNRDDEDVMMMQRQGSHYHFDDGGSSSSGSNYAGSPRRSPYGGYNTGLQNHFMATMIDKMSFMSQREGLKQQQRMLERIARSSADQQEYNIVNSGRHMEERAGPGTSNSSALESVPGHVPVAAQGLGPGQVNKELIQQLVEEQYHRLQQQQQEKQPPALICTSSTTAQHNDQAEQQGLTTPPGARSGSPEYGSGGWTRQEPRGIDGWQQEEMRNLAVQQQDQQAQVSTIRANPLIQQTVKNRMEDQGIEDEKMDQDIDELEDCESGLCSALNDQTGPEYRDISRLFNISNLMDLSNGNSVIANDSSQRISVIQEGPRITTEEEMKVPLKKRTCTKMCQSYVRKFLYAEPIMALTFEEKRFIDKRVLETRQLVKMVQPQQQIKTENPVEGLTNGRIESLNSFRANFKNIFGVLRSRNIIEIDKLGLLESRFLVCAMTSIGTRMFGNGRDKTMLEQKHEETYTRLMRSPWACSFEGEEKVQCTLESVGRTIGGDEKLEVLFTTCIMRGYQDPRATFMQMESGNRHVNKPGDQPPAADLYDEPGHPSRYKSDSARCGCEDPNLLTGGQFSLLMWRYLRDSKDKKEAAEVFKRLEGLIKPLYECQNIFYYDRLPC